MGNVSMVVLTGFLSQSEKEFLMRSPAMKKPERTTTTHNNFCSLLLPEEMKERPWIVEDSRNCLATSIPTVLKLKAMSVV